MKNILCLKYVAFRWLIAGIVMLIIGCNNSAVAQNDSSFYMNTVRMNITNPMIFGEKTIIFGYERILNDNHSFSVNAGRASYPKLIGNQHLDTLGITLNSDYKDLGFNLSADYRIYLKNENKYKAPRGVYIAPFYSFNYFKRTNNWTLNTSDFQGEVSTDLILNIHTIGFEIGYQFVFWDRISLDMILFGPGIGIYNFKTQIATTLDPDDKSKLFEAINDFLSEKFPGYDYVFDGSDFKKSGVEKTTSLGFRYMIMVGYRF